MIKNVHWLYYLFIVHCKINKLNMLALGIVKTNPGECTSTVTCLMMSTLKRKFSAQYIPGGRDPIQKGQRCLSLKAVLISLKVFNLKRSKAQALEVPFRVLS